MAAEFAMEKLVLLVTVDCCRADHVSCNGYARATTPALDSLAAGGVNFPRACATAGLTAHSFPGILLSNFYQNFGRSRIVPPDITTLAQAFSASGWHTVGLSAGNPHVSHLYGYDRGFHEFHDFLGSEPSSISDSDRLPPASEMQAFHVDCRDRPEVCDMVRELTGRSGGQVIRAFAGRPWHLDAGPVLDTLIRILSESEGRRRVFCWVHLMDLHEPIYVRRSRLGRFWPAAQQLLNAWGELYRSDEMLEDLGGAGEELFEQMAGKIRDHYDSALSYVDLQLGRLFNFLRGEGLFRRSLVCVSADHGQELFEEGVFGHWYGRPMSRRLIRVPLVFGGGLADPLQDVDDDRIVSTLDVGPTLLDLSEVQSPETFLGTSLRDGTPRPAHGQSFYQGTDPRTAADDLACICMKDRPGHYRVGPYPAPVRDCLHEMGFRAQDGRMFRYDTGRGEEIVLDLDGAEEGESSDESPGSLREQTDDYFNAVYNPAGDAIEPELCEAEAEGVVERLRGLGYL